MKGLGAVGCIVRKAYKKHINIKVKCTKKSNGLVEVLVKRIFVLRRSKACISKTIFSSTFLHPQSTIIRELIYYSCLNELFFNMFRFLFKYTFTT